MNILVLSTLPHYLSIYPLKYNIYTFGYINIILLSTTASVLFHTYDNIYITYIDYFMAFMWFLYDLKIGWIYKNILFKILYMNGIIFLMNINISNNNYKIIHSLWHLLSAYKCFYISTLINENMLN